MPQDSQNRWDWSGGVKLLGRSWPRQRPETGCFRFRKIGEMVAAQKPLAASRRESQ